MTGPDAVYRHSAKHGETTVANLADLGLSQPALFRALADLLDQGRIARVRRGVYQATPARETVDTLVQVMQRYPHGVLCLLSALAFNELTTK